MTEMRQVHDSMGVLEVPVSALYGAQTQRAINNFSVSGRTLPRAFIEALLYIKASAARANEALQCLTFEQSKAIVDACELLLDDVDLMTHFPVDIFQTGSGTSSNMNANEVIATLASRTLGLEVSANDHVNFGQSSNDVIPTAIHLSAVRELDNTLLPAVRHLISVMDARQVSLSGYCKTGRTHLMDAMPLRLDQVVSGWQAQMQANLARLVECRQQLCRLPQGGTAVGTGINTHHDFAARFCLDLSRHCGADFQPADNFFALIGAQDTAVALSGQLKTTAVSLIKIANDLRWMNSGPLSGLGEISLPALQPGSSIMPGKVNPVIPEAVAMAATQVIGNDAAVTVAGQSGNFELNVMLPMIAANVLDSIALLANSCHMLADKAIAGFTVNDARLQASLAVNPILVTALNPVIGYEKAAAIAKAAYRDGRPIIDVAAEHTSLSRNELAALLDPVKLTQGGLS